MISFIKKSITNFEDFHGVEIDSVSELLRISRIYYLKHLIRWLFKNLNYSVSNSPLTETPTKISVNPQTSKKILIYSQLYESRKILSELLKESSNNVEIIEKNIEQTFFDYVAPNNFENVESKSASELNIFLIDDVMVDYKETTIFVELCRRGKYILLVVDEKENSAKFEKIFMNFKNSVSQTHCIKKFDWKKFSVVCVNLQSAYRGLTEKDQKLFELSNFSELEKFIQNFN